MKRNGITSVLLSVMLAATLFTGCGKQAGYGGEGHFKDACLNESYHETEMMNVKGEKVDVSSDNILLIQKYGYGLTYPDSWQESDATDLIKANLSEDGKVTLYICTEAVMEELAAIYENLNATSDDYDAVYQKLWDTGYALLGLCCTDGESGFEKDFSSVEKSVLLEGKITILPIMMNFQREGIRRKNFRQYSLVLVPLMRSEMV